jgi:hypothetical protein
MNINDVLGNHRKPEQPIEILSNGDVLVKEKVKVAEMFHELAKNWLLGLTMYPIGS